MQAEAEETSAVGLGLASAIRFETASAMGLGSASAVDLGVMDHQLQWDYGRYLKKSGKCVLDEKKSGEKVSLRRCCPNGRLITNPR